MHRRELALRSSAVLAKESSFSHGRWHDREAPLSGRGLDSGALYCFEHSVDKLHA